MLFWSLVWEFLGYIITQQGIEAYPDQIMAIINVPSSKNKQKFQKLVGWIAALGKFISHLTDKCQPFFKLLKGNKKFEWNKRCQLAFDGLKRYLSTPPILAKLLIDESLFLYLAVTEDTVNAILIKHTNGEQLVYYVRKLLLDTETRYPVVEKLALALITTARKLRHISSLIRS